MQPQEQNQPGAPQNAPQPQQAPASTDWQQPTAPVAADASMPQPQPEQQSPDVNVPAAAAPVKPQPVTESVSEQPQVVEAGMAVDDGHVASQPGEEELVRWQATEHIHRQKTAIWYGIFTVVVIALIAVAIFIVNSVTFAILVPVMAIALAVYTTHPPAMLDYTLSRKGLHVNDRLYGFDSFKEFGLIHGDDENSIMLVPRKRFQPGLTIYFPDEAGEAIVDMLAARLPMHEVRLDPIDRLIRRLHI